MIAQAADNAARDPVPAADCDDTAPALVDKASGSKLRSAAVSAARHRFPAVDAGIAAVLAPAVDLALFIVRLDAALTALAGLPCRVTMASGPTDGEAGSPNFLQYVAADGSRLGIAISTSLAEALVSYRCGGGLSIQDGMPSGAASVLRLHGELLAAILRIAASCWLADGVGWSPALVAETGQPLSPPPLHHMAISVGELSLPLGLAVTMASAGGETSAPAAWAHDLRRSIEHTAFQIRAVLFETRLPLAKAAQLRPGDVLPIETPREVGLRVGAHRLASGTILPTGDGGHLVTIRAGDRLLRQPALEKVPL